MFSNESNSPGDNPSDQAFINAVVQGLMDVKHGRLMELAEVKAKLASDNVHEGGRQALALLDVLEQSQQTVSLGMTVTSVDAFAYLRQRRGLL